MPYCIEYKDKNGQVRYLDERSKPSEVPYFWKKQTSAEAVIRGRIRDGVRYWCKSAEHVRPMVTTTEAVNQKEKAAHTDSESISVDPNVVADALRTISGNIRDLEQSIECCRNAVSKEDRITQDILHYVEFEKCDAIMISKLFRILKQSRMERRKYKDLLTFFELLNKTLSEDDRKRIRDAVDLYDSRVYSPKELHSLFKTDV